MGNSRFNDLSLAPGLLHRDHLLHLFILVLLITMKQPKINI